MQTLNPILILGLGNELLCDDAIGIHLVSEFEKLFPSPAIHFKTSCTGGLEIVEIITGYNQVIIIDAIKTQNGVPGRVYHFTLSDFKNTSHVSSFHDISFLTALKFADYVDIKIPENIHILAVEIVEDMLFSDQFSASICKEYDQIKTSIKAYLDQLIPENYFEDRKNTASLTATK